MQDDETDLAFDDGLGETLEALFNQSREQLPGSPELVARVIDQASRRLRLRRRVLLGAALAAMVCCALLLWPALSALVGFLAAGSQPGVVPALVAMLQSPYSLAIALAALCWWFALGAEPG